MNRRSFVSFIPATLAALGLGRFAKPAESEISVDVGAPAGDMQVVSVWGPDGIKEVSGEGYERVYNVADFNDWGLSQLYEVGDTVLYNGDTIEITGTYSLDA